MKKDDLVQVEQVINRKHATFKDIYNMGYLPAKTTDKNPFSMKTCNVSVTHDILNEYSQDKYWHIAQVFDEAGKHFNWPPFAYFNSWIHSGSVPELTELYQKILLAKRTALEYEIIKLTNDDSHDYLRDKRGELMLDDNGKPIPNNPAISRLKMRISTLSQINLSINPDYGKTKQQEIQEKNQVSSIEMMAQAIGKAFTAKQEQSPEKEVNSDFIDHKDDE